MKNSYKYEDPLQNGYKKVYLSKDDYNRLFKRRQIRWYQSCDYYLKDDAFEIHKAYNYLFILIATISLPFLCLLSLIECKETLLNYKNLYRQKKLGNFSLDRIYKSERKFKEIKRVLEDGKAE